MNLSLIAACLWAIGANVSAMFPSRRKHWPAAIVLIVMGIPILGWVTYENGPLWGLLALAAGMSVLRWPAVFLWRWIRRQASGPAE